MTCPCTVCFVMYMLVLISRWFRIGLSHWVPFFALISSMTNPSSTVEAVAIMQIEIKLVLGGGKDFNFVREALSKDLISVERHVNYFFDTPTLTLLNSGAHLRLRFVNEDSVGLSLKEHASYDSGASSRWATEVSLDKLTGQRLAENPSLFFNLLQGNQVVDTLKQHFGDINLQSIGGFETIRYIHKWDGCVSQPGLLMRLDESHFTHGTRFEIEVPGITVPVQDVLEEITAALSSLNVSFANAQESKLDFFLSKNREALAKSHMVQDAKIVLRGRGDFDRLLSALSTKLLSEEDQINFFFDGPNRELQHQQAHFRIRSAAGKFVAVLKEHQGINDGSSIYWGRQIDLSQSGFDEILRDPTKFLESDTPIAVTLKEKFGLKSLSCIGSFQNKRRTYRWIDELSIQLDHTVFPFGERFEVEVPNVTVPLADVLGSLRDELTSFGVEGEMGSESKFNIFFQGMHL